MINMGVSKSEKEKWSSEIREMMSMPFVRIDLVLEMEDAEIVKAFQQWERKTPNFLDYKDYLKFLDSQKSQMALDAKFILGKPSDYDLLIEELHNRIGFLLQLPDNKVCVDSIQITIDAYLSIIEHLAKYLDGSNISSFIYVDRFLAVIPSMVPCDNLNDTDKLEVIKKIENVVSNILGIKSGLSTPQLNNLIWLSTYIVFFYKYYCYKFGIGTSSNIINSLFHMPQWMGTPYLDVEGKIKINFSLLCLHLSFGFFKWDEPLNTKYGISYRTYENLRFILNNSLQLLKKQNISFYIPIFQWFISRIDSDICHHFSNNQKLEYYYLHDIDKVRILACCERFRNYRYPVSVEGVVRFLQQFNNRMDAEVVLRILEAIDFFEFWQLAERLEDAIKDIKNKTGELAICPLGPVSGSTALMHYFMAHSGIEGIMFFDNVIEALRKSDKSSAICFIDDCALTGIQSNDILNTLMGVSEPYNNEMLILTENDRKELLKRKVGIGLSIISDIAMLNLKKTFKSLNIGNVYISYGSMTLEEEKVFSSASRVAWKDINERKRIRRTFQQIGMRLLQAKAIKNKWSQKEHKRHSLGYGDFQKLIVFPYSVPKPTLVALWAGIKELESPWYPLFPLVVQDDTYYPIQ